MATQGSYSLSVKVIDGFSSKLKSFNDQMQRAQAPAKRFQTQLKRFGNLTGIRKVSNNFTELTGRIRMSNDAAVDLVKNLTAVTGIVSAGALIAGFKNIAAAANSARIAGNQLGLSASTVLQQKSQSRMLGLNEDAITNSYGGVQDAMRGAATGQNADAQQIMAGASKAGFRMDQRSSPDEVIKNMLSYAKQEASNGMDAATIRGQFSAMGIDPSLMNTSRAKYEAAGDQARKLSGVTVQGTAALEQMDLKTRQLVETIRGFGTSIAQNVAPAVNNLITRFQNWLENSADVKNAITQISQGLIDLTKWIAGLPFEKMYQDTQPIIPSFATLKTILEGMIAIKVAGFVYGMISPFVSLGVSVVQTSYSIASFAVSSIASIARTATQFMASGRIISMAASVMRVAITTATGPIGIAVAAIGLAAYEIYKHWDKIGPYFWKTWDFVKNVFNIALKALGINTTAIKNTFSVMWNGIKSVFDMGWKYIVPIIEKIQSGIGLVSKVVGVGKNLYNDITGKSSDDTSSQGQADTGGPVAFRPSALSTNINGDGYKAASGITKRLEELGLSHAAAVGAAANMMKESNFNEKAVGDGGQAFGLGQWHKDRQDAIAQHFGKKVQSMSRDEQLQAYAWEMGTSQGGNVLKRLQGVNDANQAAGIISKYFERPAAQQQEMADRGRIASNIDQNGQISTPPPVYAMNDNVVSDQVANTGSIHVTVGIDENNHIKVTTKSNGSGIKVADNIMVSKRPVISNTLA